MASRQLWKLLVVQEQLYEPYLEKDTALGPVVMTPPGTGCGAGSFLGILKVNPGGRATVCLEMGGHKGCHLSYRQTREQ